MASRSLNRVILIGNLTRDPELKYTPTGTAVCTFGVATNRTWTTNDGQTKEETQYHRIVAWQKLAELCGKLLTKGRKVYLEGRLTYRTFTNRDGQQRSVAEIVLDDFILVNDGKRLSTNEELPEQKSKEKIANVETAENELEATVEELTQKEPASPEVVSEKSKEEDNEKNKEESVNPDDIPF